MTRAAWIASVVLAAAALSGCTESELDSGKVERELADELRQNIGPDLTLECPDGISADKGERFSCRGTAGGERYDISAELLDEDGRYRVTDVRAVR